MAKSLGGSGVLINNCDGSRDACLNQLNQCSRELSAMPQSFTPLHGKSALNRTQDPTSSAMKQGETWTVRLGLFAASLSSVLVAGPEAHAAVIKVTGQPISVSLGSTGDNFWDIDSDGTYEANFKANTTGTPAKFTLAIQWLFSNSLSIVQNRGLTLYGDNTFKQLGALASGSVVGPVLAAGKFWDSPSPAGQLVMSRTYEKFANSSALDVFQRNGYLTEFNNKTEYFGFRFKIDGQTHYGYGQLAVSVPGYDPGDLNRNVTLISWAYNTVPGEGLDFPSPDEEVPGPIGLAGLAAGAAWTRKLRRRIRHAAEAA